MLLIFDWDGTISDSTGLITRVMQRAAREVGWTEPPDEAVHNIIGLGMPEALQHLFPQADPGKLEQFLASYRGHYVREDRARPSALFPGVRETLEHLRDEGYRMAVATSKSRVGLDRVLRAHELDGFFHASRCADETASKPDPRMLRELLAELEARPEASAMVGDTEYDMEMGRRAGMARIAVSYGAHAVERLHPYEPALCLDRFDQLLGWERLG